MRWALCNEVLRELPFAEQCRLAAALGYKGLEVAPFTLSEEPHQLPGSRRDELRRIAAREGVRISGLHWLLVTPPGLSITAEEEAVRRKTAEFLCSLVDLCADLGGEVLVHGSPKQRMLPAGRDPGEVRRWVVELFRRVAERAEQRGVRYCIEPLGRQETNFINTLEEAVGLVRDVGSPAFVTMLDTKAAAAEGAAPVELFRRWYPAGVIGHVHLNDRNLRAPGQGADRFAPLLAALLESGYSGWASVEPFEYVPDGPTAAARAVGYLEGILECLSGAETPRRNSEAG
ncbi:MAG: sugar phosphate isomerase/epimerase [Acidobacteriota bacterium]